MAIAYLLMCNLVKCLESGIYAEKSFVSVDKYVLLPLSMSNHTNNLLITVL